MYAVMMGSCISGDTLCAVECCHHSGWLFSAATCAGFFSKLRSIFHLIWVAVAENCSRMYNHGNSIWCANNCGSSTLYCGRNRWLVRWGAMRGGGSRTIHRSWQTRTEGPIQSSSFVSVRLSCKVYVNNTYSERKSWVRIHLPIYGNIQNTHYTTNKWIISGISAL